MENRVFKGDIYSSLLIRGEDDIDTQIDASTENTWLLLNGDIKRVWSVGCDLSFSLEQYMRGLEVEVDMALNYDEYYNSLIPIVAIGVVKAF